MGAAVEQDAASSSLIFGRSASARPLPSTGTPSPGGFLKSSASLLHNLKLKIAAGPDVEAPADGGAGLAIAIKNPIIAHARATDDAVGLFSADQRVKIR